MQLLTLTRRNLLRAMALAGSVPFMQLPPLLAAPAKGKTPALTLQEIADIEIAMGKKGTYNQAQAVHTTPLPRNDLKVTLKGEPVPIPFGFGGWASIKKTLDGKSAVLMSDTVLLEEEANPLAGFGCWLAVPPGFVSCGSRRKTLDGKSAVLMSDTVLLEEEVNPLISAAQANGLEISAIHNHFFYEQPRIFYMHLHGMGSPKELATKFAATIKDFKIAPANQPQPAAATAAQTGNTGVSTQAPPTGKELFDLPALDAIVKYEGVVNGPTYKYTVGREDLTVMAMGAEMTAAIGLNSWAGFAGNKDNAHVAGDIAMLEGEVNAVIKSLRQSNLEVVALHHHMLGDDPRMVFLHYYGRGPATTLAQGFRAALDQLEKGKTHLQMKH